MKLLKVLLISSVCACALGNIKWLAIKNFPINNVWESNDVCTKSYGFTTRQVKFCRRQFPWMYFVQDTARDVSDECQSVLKQHDWNCQSIDKAPMYNDDLKKNTKQSAFVHALSASSLALTVAKGCMAGKLQNCICQSKKERVSFTAAFVDRDNATKVNEMVSCKGIIDVGKRFSYDFMNTGIRWKAKNDRHKKEMVIRKHNIQIGLNALKDAEYISCTCNGATAGCTMKFCHRRLKLFQDISSKLMRKFENAVHVTGPYFKTIYKNSAPHRRSFWNTDLTKNDKSHGTKLIYTDNVDHCTFKGMYSSTGRRCSLDDTKLDSCNKICCGKGHRERRIEIHSKCRCKFVYCCKVQCEICVRYDTIFECS